jgi:hypothetical protein
MPDEKFLFTDEACEQIIKTLRLKTSLEQILDELINQGVEQEEKEAFEQVINGIIQILIEYCGCNIVKVIERATESFINWVAEKEREVYYLVWKDVKIVLWTTKWKEISRKYIREGVGSLGIPI